MTVTAGVHHGPFQVPAGTHLIGMPGAILTAAEGENVVEAAGDVSLSQLVVEGGARGVVEQGAGRVELSNVILRYQTIAALQLPQGRLMAQQLQLIGRGNRAGEGLILGPASQSQVEKLQASGPLTVALDVGAGARLEVTDFRMEDAQMALKASHAQVVMAKVLVDRGTGPAFFTAGGELTLRNVHVRGHEYALLARDQALVTLEDFHSHEAQRAAVGVVQSRLKAKTLGLSGSGALGGVQSVNSQVELHDVEIEQARDAALNAQGGSLQAEDVRITDVKGEAVHLARVEAQLTNVSVSRAKGACVTILEGAHVKAKGLQLEGCGGGAWSVSSGAELRAADVRVQGGRGPVLGADDRAHVILERWTVSGMEGELLEVNCDDGQVRVERHAFVVDRKVQWPRCALAR